MYLKQNKLSKWVFFLYIIYLHIFPFPFQLLYYFVKHTTRHLITTSFIASLNTSFMWFFLCSYFPSMSSDLLLLHWNHCNSCQLFKQSGALKFRVLILCACVSCGVHTSPSFWHYYIPGYYPHKIPLRPTLLGYGQRNKINFIYGTYKWFFICHVILLLESSW